jgi:hypothetical protein
MQKLGKVMDNFDEKVVVHVSPMKIDSTRIALALKCHQQCDEFNLLQPTPAQVEEFHKYVEEMDDNNMDEYIQSRITHQIINLFECINSSESYQQFKSKAEFHLEVKESSLPSAGNGLFAISHKPILPGTVVALYPGLVHIPQTKDYIQTLLPDDNLMLMSRNDGSIIDGRTADIAPTNPYGFAQFINHCGDRHKPNCVQVTYDFPEDFIKKSDQFPKHLRKLIPNEYAQLRSSIAQLDNVSHCMKGLAFVSMRHIKSGDELLIDYRLNPSADHLPAWYAHFDAEGAKERWGEMTDKYAAVADEEKKEANEDDEKKKEKPFGEV